MLLDRIHSFLQIRLRANIALTSVLLAGAVLITTGVAILYNAIDVTIVSKHYVGRQFASLKLDSCIEEGMRRLVINPLYTGTFTITFPDGSCQASIVDEIGQTTKKRITVIATVEEYTVTRVKKIDTATSPYSLSN